MVLVYDVVSFYGYGGVEQCVGVRSNRLAVDSRDLCQVIPGIGDVVGEFVEQCRIPASLQSHQSVLCVCAFECGCEHLEPDGRVSVGDSQFAVIAHVVELCVDDECIIGISVDSVYVGFHLFSLTWQQWGGFETYGPHFFQAVGLLIVSEEVHAQSRLCRCPLLCVRECSLGGCGGVVEDMVDFSLELLGITACIQSESFKGDFGICSCNLYLHHIEDVALLVGEVYVMGLLARRLEGCGELSAFSCGELQFGVAFRDSGTATGLAGACAPVEVESRVVERAVVGHFCQYGRFGAFGSLLGYMYLSFKVWLVGCDVIHHTLALGISAHTRLLVECEVAVTASSPSHVEVVEIVCRVIAIKDNGMTATIQTCTTIDDGLFVDEVVVDTFLPLGLVGIVILILAFAAHIHVVSIYIYNLADGSRSGTSILQL